MTEPEEYDDRAARAFGVAFERAAEGFEPVPLDPTASSRGRGALARIGAVAAAIALVAAGTSYGARWFENDTGSATRPAGPSAHGDGLPEPQAGWRYESYRDMVVAVPEAWGYGSSPGPDWCASQDDGQLKGDRPSADPIVDLRGEFTVVATIGCFAQSSSEIFGNVPEQLWVTHVGFRRSSAAGGGDALPDGEVTDRGWTRIVRTVGAAQVQVVTEETHLDVARRIVASARQVEQDHNGCDATSPIQAGRFARPERPFDVSRIGGVDRIVICQYDLRDADRPGLIASSRLDGEQAERELRAIQEAPVGGGPNTPNTCVPDMWGDTAVVMGLVQIDTIRWMHVYYEWCFGNGFDDGTHVRALTRANCPPLWGGRVRTWSGSSAPFRACQPAN